MLPCFSDPTGLLPLADSVPPSICLISFNSCPFSSPPNKNTPCDFFFEADFLFLAFGFVPPGETALCFDLLLDPAFFFF